MTESTSNNGLEPATRRLIVAVLTLIAVTGVVAEVGLSIFAGQSSEALLSLSSVAVGAIAGMAVPHAE